MTQARDHQGEAPNAAPWRSGGNLAVPADLLSEIIRRIVEVAQPDRIILFGSFARGEAGPDSDIDLLIVKSNVAHRRRLAQQIRMKMFGVPVPVDIMVVTPEDLERYAHAVGTIIGPALQEGREVYAA
ncbi:MAG: nucleotidyltransferase domain-containing protein [Longimicrobiales bacterium]